jgi:hypothetical protein
MIKLCKPDCCHPERSEGSVWLVLVQVTQRGEGSQQGTILGTADPTQTFFFNGRRDTTPQGRNYDSIGRCQSIVYNAHAIVTDVIDSKNDSAIGVFLYFPHPPGLEAFYKIGLIDDQQIKSNEILLKSDKLFLDTIIQNPKRGLNYYFSVDYKNIFTDTLVNVFFQKF